MLFSTSAVVASIDLLIKQGDPKMGQSVSFRITIFDILTHNNVLVLQTDIDNQLIRNNEGRTTK